MVEIKEESKEKDYINIKVLDHEGTEIEYRVRRSVSFAKILEQYSKSRNKNPKDFRLARNGKFLSLSESPESFGLENGEELEVMASQTGGNFKIV